MHLLRIDREIPVNQLIPELRDSRTSLHEIGWKNLVSFQHRQKLFVFIIVLVKKRAQDVRRNIHDILDRDLKSVEDGVHSFIIFSEFVEFDIPIFFHEDNLLLQVIKMNRNTFLGELCHSCLL